MWDLSKRHTRIKLCDFESLDPAYEACSLGVDALGFHLFEGQHLEERALRFRAFFRYLPDTVDRVLLTNLDRDRLLEALSVLDINTIQLYPDWSRTEIHEFRSMIAPRIRVLKVMSAQPEENSITDYREFLAYYTDAVDGILLDSYRIGGTGKTADWDLCAEIVEGSAIPVFLAGGLNAENVVEAISRVRPFGVDVENGVSDRISGGPLVKNMAKCRAFVEAVRSEEQIRCQV
jgi:phosphoribosylanthranilate isomerase